MGEPKAITYKEVARVTGGDRLATVELWHKIGDITGAGHVGLDIDGNASIDLTDVSDSKRERIDALMGVTKDEQPEAPSKSKKEGK